MAESVSDSIDRMLQEMKALTEQMKVDSRRRRQKELDDRTLLIKIHQLDYEISWNVLDQVFAGFGGIEYLEVFSSDDDYHSKIRFRSTYSANRVFDSLNHRDIYDGCCRLELFRVTEVVGEREIESPIEDASQGIDSTPQIVENSGEQESPYESSSANLDEESANTSYPQSEAEVVPSIEVPESPRTFDRVLEVFSESRITLPYLLDDLEEMEVPDQRITQNSKTDQAVIENPEVLQIQFDASKVYFCIPQSKDVELAKKENGKLVDNSMNSRDLLVVSNAHQLFVEMFEKDELMLTRIKDKSNASIQLGSVYPVLWHGSWIFDPGILESCTTLSRVLKGDVYVVLRKPSSSQECIRIKKVVGKTQMGKVISSLVEWSFAIDEFVDNHRQMLDGPKEPNEPVDFRVNSIGFLEIPSAHQVFVEMPRRGDEWLTALVDGYNSMSRYMEFIVILWPYDRGKLKRVRSEDRLINVFAAIDHEVALFHDPKDVVQEFESRMVIFGIISELLPLDTGREGVDVLDVQLGSEACSYYFELCSWLESERPSLISLPYDRGRVRLLLPCWNIVSGWVLVFDPGGSCPLLTRMKDMYCAEFSCADFVGTYLRLSCILVFDPSGVLVLVSKGVILLLDITTCLVPNKRWQWDPGGEVLNIS